MLKRSTFLYMYEVTLEIEDVNYIEILYLTMLCFTRKKEDLIKNGIALFVLVAVCLKLSYFAAIYKTAYHNDKSLKLSHDEIKLFFKQCNHVRMNQSFCFLCSIVVSKAELSLGDVCNSNVFPNLQFIHNWS